MKKLSEEEFVDRAVQVIELYCKNKPLYQIADIIGIKETSLKTYIGTNKIHRDGYYGNDDRIIAKIPKVYIKSKSLINETSKTNTENKKDIKYNSNKISVKPYTIIDREERLVLYKGQIAKILNKEELRQLFIRDGILDSYNLD